MDPNNNETPAPENTGHDRPDQEVPDFSNEKKWAETLKMDFDADEARRRATPPPYQSEHPDPNFGHRQEPYGSQPPSYDQPLHTYDAPQQPYGNPQPLYNGSGLDYENGFSRPPMPPTYLVWAIISTICCCLPAGIVAIIFSANVSSKYFARDYDGAKRASDRAQWWIIISIVVGIIVNSLYVPLSLLLP